MAQIPKTQQKLREARFFLGHVSKAGRSPQLEREDFYFYLSAFLSAGRSVSFVLMAEQTKARYEPWFTRWRTTLSDDESKLLDFMNDQRVAVVHVLGAETQGDIEMMPLTQYESEFRPGNISWMVAGSLPRGIPPAEMGVIVHYFKIAGKKENVVEICKRYVALLEKLIREFDQTFP